MTCHRELGERRTEFNFRFVIILVTRLRRGTSLRHATGKTNWAYYNNNTIIITVHITTCTGCVRKPRQNFDSSRRTPPGYCFRYLSDLFLSKQFARGELPSRRRHQSTINRNSSRQPDVRAQCITCSSVASLNDFRYIFLLKYTKINIRTRILS